MLSWFRRDGGLPPAARPMARALFAELGRLGLLPGVKPPDFDAALLAALDASLLEELAEAWGEASSPESSTAVAVRRQVASRAFGIHTDWRFDPADVAAMAARRLPGRPSIAATRERRGEAEVGGRRVPDFLVTVRLDGAPAVRWRCSSALGFVDAVNAAVARAGHAGRFVALETDGDYHAFVHADAAARERLAASALLPPCRETDPISGPVEEERA